MTTDVLTATASETAGRRLRAHARAGRGLGGRGRRRAAGGHPHRARPGAGGGGGRRPGHGPGLGLDDARPRHGQVHRRHRRRLQEPQGPRLPPLPGGRRRPPGRHRVDARHAQAGARSCPCEHPGAIEAKRGLEGVVVAETSVGDVRGHGGLLPLPPVQRGRAGREAQPGGRLAPPLRGPPALRRRAGGVRRRDPVAAGHPDGGQGDAPDHRHRGRALHPPRRAAHAPTRRWPTRPTSSRGWTSTPPPCGPTPCRRARSCRR